MLAVYRPPIRCIYSKGLTKEFEMSFIIFRQLRLFERGMLESKAGASHSRFQHSSLFFFFIDKTLFRLREFKSVLK